MTTYLVKEKCYINSRIYKPGERVEVAKEFKKIPSWATLVKPLTPQQKAAATKKANAAAKKAAEDDQDVKAATHQAADFLGADKDVDVL